jgi:YfiH family protein
MGSLPIEEAAPEFAELGVLAFTTGRKHGDFRLDSRLGLQCDPPGPWATLVDALAGVAERVAVSRQVHGRDILLHGRDWSGWRVFPEGADGHFSLEVATAMAVTLADCVPVFMAHPAGGVAVVHSGWRGTAAGIAAAAVERFERAGLSAVELRVHLGPAICGSCYRVGRDVLEALTGLPGQGGLLDLRSVLERQLRAAGVRRITTSNLCTRCHNGQFFSHRAGDSSRQVALIVRLAQ